MYTLIVGSFLIMFLLGTALGRELLFGIVTDVIVTESPEVLASEIETSTPDPNSPTPSESITLTLTPIPDELVTSDTNNSDELELSVTPNPEDELIPTSSSTPKPSQTHTPTPASNAASQSNTASPTVVPSITLTSGPTLSPTVTLTPTVPLTPTPVAKLLVAPAYLEPLFNQYAAQYNVDGQLLRKIANCESHYNTGVVGGGGLYGGMFQFAVGSWQSLRIKMGMDANPDLRFGANESIQTAAYAISLGKASMWPSCSK